MDVMPFYLVFIQSLPETAILVSLGLVLIGVKPQLIPVLLVGLLTALASSFIRALPLPPGINIILQLPIMIVLLSYLQKIPLSFALLASFLGLICMSLTEILFNFFVSSITGITVKEAMSNSLWRILFPLPEFTFLIAVIMFLLNFRISIFDLHELENVSNYEEK